METLQVHSIETFGTHEGPGIRLVVFLQGCHLRCLYCHNPDTWNLDGGKPYTAEQILALLEKEKAYFNGNGGLTVSGGEPLLQRKALIPLFNQVKAKGIHICLDTNGSVLDESTKELLEYTDLVLLDIKQMDEKRHKELTGVSNCVPLQFAEYLEETGKDFWIRNVLVPSKTLDTESLEQLGQHFKNYRSLKRLELLPYHTYGVYKYKELGIPYRLANTPAPSPDELARAEHLLKQFIPQVYVR